MNFKILIILLLIAINSVANKALLLRCLEHHNKVSTPVGNQMLELKYSIRAEFNINALLPVYEEQVEIGLSHKHSYLKNENVEIFSNQKESFTITHFEKKVYWDNHFKPQRLPFENLEFVLSQADTISYRHDNGVHVFTLEINQMIQDRNSIRTVSYHFNADKTLKEMNVLYTDRHPEFMTSYTLIVNRMKLKPIPIGAQNIRNNIFKSKNIFLDKYKKYQLELVGKSN